MSSGPSPAAAKAELPEAESVHREFVNALAEPVYLISSVTGQGLKQMLDAATAAGASRVSMQIESCNDD